MVKVTYSGSLFEPKQPDAIACITQDLPDVAPVHGAPNPALRGQIRTLEDRMREAMNATGGLTPLPDGAPVKHYFAPGMYAREILLPKGSLVIGKIHKHAHLNIISKGRVSVVTEFGAARMTGPFTFVSQVGTKRVVYAHEDTIWTTIHLTEETDLDKVEEETIAKSYNDLDAPDFFDGSAIEGVKV